ncbi:hypothetical protein NSA19_02320 [Actinomyces bowdenii]|uniref:hypothetical protein n=1 Tax=Actinomyces bowdenii TaxID=131109 RepID=UPI00214AFFBD|nr:hypothetical protein [Actinomyces bowdenii]MCR2051706.1 hypothetical protein [Actinomyces bowdenii]
MNRRIASPLDLITRQDAVMRGAPADSLSRRSRGSQADLIRLRRGVYARRDQWRGLRPELQHLARICASRACGRSRGDGAALARESAAIIHGLPMIGPLPDRLQYASPGASGGEVNAVSRLLPAPEATPVEVVDGLVVVDAVHTAAELMRRRPFRSGLVTADHVLREGMATVEELTGVIASGSGRHGNARAALCLRYADPASESVGESLSRAVMIEHRLPLPQLQETYRAQDGSVLGRVDFVWPEHGVIGEFDGAVKYSRQLAVADPWRTAQAERLRENRLERATRMRLVRWIWKDAFETEPLLRILASVGLLPGH